MKKLSIVVPCYNEEKVIKTSYERIKKAIQNLAYLSEIIFVNDGSADKTGEILSNLAKSDSIVKVVTFSRNFGHQTAVTAGINYCSGDVAIIMDADMQDPPELIPDMIKTMDDNLAQVVYCVRKKRKGVSVFKNLSYLTFYRLLNLFSEIKLPLDSGDFRLIDKSVITEFNRMHEKGKYVRGLIGWIGFKQVPFYYERDARLAGDTKYPLSKLIKLASTSMLYFSTKPLRIATSIGIIAVFISLILAVWSVLGKIYGFTGAGSGWTSLFVIIIFLGGIQLLTIGIIGSYIGNLFTEIKNRPEYIVSKKENFEEEKLISNLNEGK